MVTSRSGRVLIVEDERELADTYGRWLSDTYEVTVAYTGEEALAVLPDDLDVVLLDRRLPGIPGREVLAGIKERVAACRVAVITAVDPDFDVLDMAFDDYVVKPVLKGELEEVVARMMKLKTYDKQFQESFSLANKRRILEREKSRASLAENDEYTAVTERLSEVSAELDLTFGEFDGDDFELVYRELATEESPGEREN